MPRHVGDVDWSIEISDFGVPPGMGKIARDVLGDESSTRFRDGQSVSDSEVESKIFNIAGVVLEFELKIVSGASRQRDTWRDSPDLGRDLHRDLANH